MREGNFTENGLNDPLKWQQKFSCFGNKPTAMNLKKMQLVKLDAY